MLYLGASIYVIYVITRIKPHFLFSSSINCSVIISFCMSEMALSCIEIILYSPSSSLSLAPGFVSAFKRLLSLFSATIMPLIRHVMNRSTMFFSILSPFHYGCQPSCKFKGDPRLSQLKDSI